VEGRRNLFPVAVALGILLTATPFLDPVVEVAGVASFLAERVAGRVKLSLVVAWTKKEKEFI
jgi:hypothetical protein